MSDPKLIAVVPAKPRTCEVVGCHRKHLARGYCRPHYRKLRRWGDPLGGKPDARTRFNRKIVMAPGDGCWTWCGAMDANGYGRFWDGSKSTGAHRFAYEIFVGPIGEGLQIDHLCFNPCCVRPSHLEAVTPRVNTIRAIDASRRRQRTHCKRGHPWDGAGSDSFVGHDGYRVCRHCNRINKRARVSARVRSRFAQAQDVVGHLAAACMDPLGRCRCISCSRFVHPAMLRRQHDHVWCAHCDHVNGIASEVIIEEADNG